MNAEWVQAHPEHEHYAINLRVGTVRSLPRDVVDTLGFRRHVRGRVLRPVRCSNGTGHQVTLSRGRVGRKTYVLSTLLAQARRRHRWHP